MSLEIQQLLCSLSIKEYQLFLSLDFFPLHPPKHMRQELLVVLNTCTSFLHQFFTGLMAMHNED